MAHKVNQTLQLSEFPNSHLITPLLSRMKVEVTLKKYFAIKCNERLKVKIFLISVDLSSKRWTATKLIISLSKS